MSEEQACRNPPVRPAQSMMNYCKHQPTRTDYLTPHTGARNMMIPASDAVFANRPEFKGPVKELLVSLRTRYSSDRPTAAAATTSCPARLR